MWQHISIAIIGFVLMQGCSHSTWSDEEMDQFLEACMAEGGDKSYCKCYLEKTMAFSPVAEEADKIAYEVKVELAKDCD